jgi:FlaA1/EpsC-like NDP-sugar epimerase
MNSVAGFFFSLRNRHFFVLDTLAFLLLPVIALAIRMDGSIDLDRFGYGLFNAMITFTVIKMVLFYFSGMYQRYWRYASIDEVAYISVVTVIAIILQTIAFIFLYYVPFLPLTDLPRSIPVLDGLLSLLYVGGIRFSVRLTERVNERTIRSDGERTLIVGAGKTGVSLATEMQRNPHNGYLPVAFVDDDRRKRKLQVRGLSIEGNRSAIPDIVERYNISKVIIAMPTASGSDIREIVEICKKCGVEVNTIPSIFELINGEIKLESIRQISIEDLLRRDPVKTNISKVAGFISGKKILVTGAGGSIGSEVCRQLLQFSPAEIALLGHGENTVFDVQQELSSHLRVLRRNSENGVKVPKLHTYIADIRSKSRLKIIFDSFQPDIIFHAAAHKHVPMMENNVAEAISNNVFGTQNLLFLATRYNVEHFVNISTDKAVNPTSIMGVSKRISEILVMQAAKRTGRRFVCVRFGNVLGSNGSVIPTFKRQILQGGPVTVTHPDVRRYFMTIPEAVQLVLQSAVIGTGGEIFVLDMGEPIRIVDLAKDIIRLSGLEEGIDIDIEYIGLRQGEKLFEELFIQGEDYAPTEHEKILIACNASQIIPEGLDTWIERLYDAARRNNEKTVRDIVEQLVPEYTPYPLNGKNGTGKLAESAEIIRI